MKNKWIYTVFILTFILSLLFGFISNLITSRVDNLFLAVIIIIVIIFGIVFDAFGVAVLTSKEANFHAMSSRRVKGAKEAIKLIKNSANIASLFNDVVGDICGIVSGTLSAVFTVYLVGVVNINSILLAMLVTAFTSTFTVTGKAYMKNVAVKNSDQIVLFIGRVMSIFTKE